MDGLAAELDKWNGVGYIPQATEGIMNKLIAGLIHAIGALTVYTLVSPLWAIMYLGFLVGVMNERLSTKDEVELNER